MTVIRQRLECNIEQNVRYIACVLIGRADKQVKLDVQGVDAALLLILARVEKLVHAGIETIREVREELILRKAVDTV